MRDSIVHDPVSSIGDTHAMRSKRFGVRKVCGFGGLMFIGFLYIVSRVWFLGFKIFGFKHYSSWFGFQDFGSSVEALLFTVIGFRILGARCKASRFVRPYA